MLPGGSRSRARSGIVTEYAMRPARGSAGDHLESLPPPVRAVAGPVASARAALAMTWQNRASGPVYAVL